MLDILPHDGAITEIRLARSPANALDLALVQALDEAIVRAPDNGARGVVLSGAQGLFSAGVDVPALLAMDRDGVLAYWNAFFQLCATMARAPVPLAAAITGHSPAGGAVLALLCDYRVMAQGPYRIGLNEVQVGLIVPEPIQRTLRRVIGAYRAERLLIAGSLLDAEQALACGFVDELTALEQVVTRAGVWMAEVLALPARAMRATRELARADLVRAFTDPELLRTEAFVDAFFEPDTQAVLHALVARLKEKR